MVLTDPPYFLDGLDTDWKKGGEDATRATGSVGGLPVAMNFEPKQGKELQKFIEEVAKGWDRVLVPGGFALVFSQPRLAHRIAAGMEDAGFEVRDLIAWHFTQRAQFKAFSQDHFVRKMNHLSDAEKKALIRSLGGRKTPQLRPQFEAVILAQKPRVGTFVENWQQYRAGLMDATRTLNGKSPSNVMVWEKPAKDERDSAGGHLTPKPLKLLEHMIELFTEPGQTVLDSFLGSGSTAVAAIRTARNCIGIELNPEYVEIARERLKGASQ
jgi:DNA modification methylase